MTYPQQKGHRRSYSVNDVDPSKDYILYKYIFLVK